MQWKEIKSAEFCSPRLKRPIYYFEGCKETEDLLFLCTCNITQFEYHKFTRVKYSGKFKYFNVS